MTCGRRAEQGDRHGGLARPVVGNPAGAVGSARGVERDKGSSAPGAVGLLVPLGSGTTPGPGVGLRFKPRSTKGPIR
jgi:hypothetical protein